ncbi:hypothetical protein [Streptomyces cinereospinus]|uniref:Uncharacterized protein n=1 Tax=Streptomyces cinereospinus TaxID=285561 RepID=A0ABV5MU67_9ACTN
MPENPVTRPDDEAEYRGEDAARNTIAYRTTDSENPLPREVQIFSCRDSGGDMYKLTVSFPGAGDFTARGREVARIAIADLDIGTL